MQTPPLALAESTNRQPQPRPPVDSGSGFAAFWAAMSGAATGKAEPDLKSPAVATEAEEIITSDPEVAGPEEIVAEEILAEDSGTDEPEFAPPQWVGSVDRMQHRETLTETGGHGVRVPGRDWQMERSSIDPSTPIQPEHDTGPVRLAADPAAQNDSMPLALAESGQTDAEADDMPFAGNDRREMITTKPALSSIGTLVSQVSSAPPAPDTAGGHASGPTFLPESLPEPPRATRSDVQTGGRNHAAAAVPTPTATMQSADNQPFPANATTAPDDDMVADLIPTSHPQTSTAPTVSTEPSPQASGVGRQVLHQLADTLIRPGERIEVSLSPEELGRVRLLATQTENGVLLVVQAERPETLDLMRKHLPDLAQELRSLGFGDVSYSDGREQQHKRDEPTHPFVQQQVETTLAAQQSLPVTGLDLRL